MNKHLFIKIPIRGLVKEGREFNCDYIKLRAINNPKNYFKDVVGVKTSKTGLRPIIQN